MKVNHLLIAGLSALSLMLPASELRMLNGNVIQIQKPQLEEGRLEVELKGGGQPLSIPANLVGSLILPAGKPYSLSSVDTLVEFQNGDRIAGTLIKMEAGQMQLQMPWNQTLDIPVHFVREIRPLPGGQVPPLAGLGSPADWKAVNSSQHHHHHHSRQPRHSKPYLSSEGIHLGTNVRVGRKIRLKHDRLLFTFGIPIQEQNTSALIQWSRDAPGKENTVTRLNYSRNHINLQVMDGGKQVMRWSGRNRSGWLPPGETLTLRVYADLKTGDRHLYMEETHVSSWEEPIIKNPAKQDMWIVLQNRYSQTDLIFSEVSVYPSPFPKAPKDGHPEIAPGDVFLRLANGDSLEGKLHAIEEEQVQLQLEGLENPLGIDRQEVISLTFPLQDSVKPRVSQKDVRIRDRWGWIRCSLQLSELNGKVLKGHSEQLGQLELPLNWLSMIEFNPYSSRRFDQAPPPEERPRDQLP